MNKKNIIVLVFCLCCAKSNCQIISDYRIFFSEFENSLTSWLIKQNRYLGDSNVVIFSNANWTKIILNKQYGGAFYEFERDGIHDSSRIVGNSRILRVEKRFGLYKFINYVASPNERSTPKLSNLGGNWIYVTCSEDDWRQFFLELTILGRSRVNIEPTVNFFKFGKNGILYAKYKVTMTFSKGQFISLTATKNAEENIKYEK